MNITLKSPLAVYSADNAAKHILETQTKQTILLSKQECITVAAQLLADPFKSLSADEVGELSVVLGDNKEYHITFQLTGSEASKLSAYLTSKKPLPPMGNPTISASVYSNAAS